MKKSIYLSVIMLCFSALVYGQEFEKGTNVLTAQVGIGSSFGTAGSSEGLGLSVNYEIGLFEVGEDVISLGGYLGRKTFNFGGILDGKLSYTIIGVRGAYHFNSLNVDNLDLYGGAMVSFNNVSTSGNLGGGTFGSALGFTIFGGGRYYFTDNIAASLELGYGVAFVNIGASFRF